jgi:hypothetical protein
VRKPWTRWIACTLRTKSQNVAVWPAAKGVQMKKSAHSRLPPKLSRDYCEIALDSSFCALILDEPFPGRAHQARCCGCIQPFLLKELERETLDEGIGSCNRSFDVCRGSTRRHR